MEIAIRDWTPAEVMMILSPNAIKGGDMLKFTFLDLIIKEVLAYEKVEKDGKIFRNILTGPLLYAYQALPHEMVCLAPFQKGQPRIELKLYVRTLTQNVGGYYNFRQKYVKRAPRLKPFFQSSFWNILNMHVLSDQGKRLQQSLKTQIEAVRTCLKNIAMRNYDPAANPLVQNLGNNVIILKEWEPFMHRKDLEVLAKSFLKQPAQVDLDFPEFDAQLLDVFMDAWSDISDAFSDGGGGSSDGGDGSSDGGSGCGGCGGGD
ncbi:MAG: hypothetical protein ACKV1O_04835 [Saprospiraceae bacterium]